MSTESKRRKFFQAEQPQHDSALYNCIIQKKVHSQFCLFNQMCVFFVLFLGYFTYCRVE